MKYTLGIIAGLVLGASGIAFAAGNTMSISDSLKFGHRDLGTVYKMYDSANNVVCYIEATSPAISAVGSASGISCVKL